VHICQSDPHAAQCAYMPVRLSLSPHFFCHNNEKQISRISRLFTFGESIMYIKRHSLHLSADTTYTHKGIRPSLGVRRSCISHRSATLSARGVCAAPFIVRASYRTFILSPAPHICACVSRKTHSFISTLLLL
jgi:hypothetical protein